MKRRGEGGDNVLITNVKIILNIKKIEAFQTLRAVTPSYSPRLSLCV